MAGRGNPRCRRIHRSRPLHAADTPYACRDNFARRLPCCSRQERPGRSAELTATKLEARMFQLAWCTHAIAVWKDDRYGPLPALLLALTMVTGIVDAVSYLKLGHVFVANMTGNVVFLGFAIADPQSFSIPASLTAIGAFLAGAPPGGRS